MPFGIQPWHIVVVVIVALIIFGPSKLPELGRSIGKAINEFRTGAREMTETMKDEMNRGDAHHEDRPSVNEAQIQPPQSIYPNAPNPSGFSVSPATGKFCTQCGAANPADARFCKSCGKPLLD